MKLVVFTRDMRPWHKGDRHAFPDDAAAKLIATGMAEPAPDNAGLAPDAPASPAPKGRYLARKAPGEAQLRLTPAGQASLGREAK